MTVPNRSDQEQKISSNQVLPGDDFAKPAVIRNEFLDEFMHAALENIVHVAVFETVANAPCVTLRGALAAIGDADLVKIADEVAIAAGERARQRIIENQQIGDQPRFQG